MINRTLEPLVVRLQWDVEETPIALELEPGVLTRATVDRPPPPPATPFERLTEERSAPPPAVLSIRTRGFSTQFSAGPGRVDLTPPGAYIPSLRPALTLAEVQAGRQQAVAVERGTSVHVRRLAGRWEVFLECRRPGAPGKEDHGRAEADGEAVTLFIGPKDEPAAELVIPERGWHRLLTGTNDGTLQVHRQSYDDRWLCRVVLPDAWLESQAGKLTLRLGVQRSHADGSAVETGPATGPPWAQAPGRVTLDLGAWEGLPEPIDPLRP
jgi:hypothetical protein